MNSTKIIADKLDKIIELLEEVAEQGRHASFEIEGDR